MEGYLGEFPVDVSTHPEFKDMSREDWVLYFIERYGQIDGDHHKQWVMDQCVRIMKGCEVIVVEAKWSPNEKYPEGLSEFRVNLGAPTEEYLEWVKYMKAGEDGPDTYDYYEGIAP